MKVIQSIVSDSEISSVIDVLDGREVSDEVRARINDEVSGYIREQTLLYVGDSSSPISGEGWKKSLSPEYANQKRAEGGTPVANLELNGDMLNAFDASPDGDYIRVGVFGSEAPKADGHNNFSGDSLLPKRRFIPEEGQKYKRDIESGIKEIVNDILAEESPVEVDFFEGVETSVDLYSRLSGVFGVTNREAIRRAVLGNTNLVDLLGELDLLDLL